MYKEMIQAIESKGNLEEFADQALLSDKRYDTMR